MSATVEHLTPTTALEDRIAYLLKDRDKSAITLIFENYGALMLNVINRILNDLPMSEDVLQIVLLKIWEKSNHFDSSKGALFTWLVSISRNAAIDKTRSKDFRLSQESRQGVEVVSISNAITADDKLEQMFAKQLIEQLPEQQLKLINMSYFEGYTHKEIAGKLDIPLGTVKTRIRLAIKHLRSII